jgi:uncharacterized protein (TIGR03083 family)
MPTIVAKDLVVPLLRREFDAVIELGRGLDEDAWDTPTCLPGWTVKDQLSHLVGTESMLDGQQAPEVDVSHLEHVRNDIGRFNELWVESLRSEPGTRVLDRFEQVTARRLRTLESMSQEDFDAPSFTPVGKDETYGRFMRIRLYDCYLHEHDMRDALGLADRQDPEQLALVVDEIAAGLGYVVARKARMPAGSGVRIRLTGAVERDLDCEVDARAELVDRLRQDPDVHLRLPVMLFLRLTGGRTDPGPHLGREVELGGDEQLARRLGENLAHTI